MLAVVVQVFQKNPAETGIEKPVGEAPPAPQGRARPGACACAGRILHAPTTAGFLCVGQNAERKPEPRKLTEKLSW